ncbi:MAG TPA: hypothetical protein VFZ77_09920 [Acidimicrobiales bacterium]
MKLIDETHQHDIEDTVRTMLRHIAADVREVQPAWEDLVRRDERVVVPLRAAEPAISDRARPRWHHRPLASVAAAALVAAAVGGALIADRGGDGGGQPATELITAVSPGAAGFEASAAAAVWSTGVGDPVAAALGYLAAAGVPTDPTVPGAATAVLHGDAGSTATVDWSLPSAGGSSGGTVYLRQAPAGAEGSGWMVVGAATPDAMLSDVAYDGEQLSFVAQGAQGASGELAVSVWVDGEVVPLPGPALPVAGPGAVPLAALTGAGGGTPPSIDLPLGPDDVVVLRLVRVVEGGVRSLTEMALAMPDADPALPAADLAASMGGGVAGAVDAANGALSGEAGAGADGTVAGGGSLPEAPELPELPGSTLPVPTEPGGPSLPLPVPTTLPPLPTDGLP